MLYWKQEDVTKILDLLKIHTVAETATIIGVSDDTIRGIRRRYAKQTYQTKELPPIPEDVFTKELQKILSKKPTGITIHDLSNQLDVSPNRIIAAVERLRQTGFVVADIEEGKISLARSAPPSIILDKYFDLRAKTFKCGIISDPHVCSKLTMWDVINTVAKHFRKAKLDAVMLPGNLTDGQDSYPGHFWELSVIGCDAQIKYTTEHWPDFGCPQYILGSSTCHDGIFFKREGFEQVRAICEKRPDMIYCGLDAADIRIGNETNHIIIRLMHPGGGSAYSISYKPQKIVEAISGGKKPHIIIVGHYHKLGYFQMRNVQVFLAGCLQAQTRFMQKRQLAAHVGAAIVEAKYINSSLIETKTQWFHFYEEGEAPWMPEFLIS